MTILTHIRPHVDDLCGIWLLSKYAPEFRGADFAYVPSSDAVGWFAAHPEAVAVGTGRGRFDEHKGDVGKCAASLVWEYVRPMVIDEVERGAIDRIVAWVLEVDTGMMVNVAWRQFTLPPIFLGAYQYFQGDNEKLRELGFTVLESLLIMERNALQLEKDWESRIVFSSRFGAAVGFVTSAQGAEDFAYGQGFDVVVTVNREKTYFNIRAKATAPVDLTSVRDELLQRDPDADWFFHHSKKILCCGGYLAPKARLSKLSLEELIEVVK